MGPCQQFIVTTMSIISSDMQIKAKLLIAVIEMSFQCFIDQHFT